MATTLQTGRERDPELDPTWDERIPLPRGGHIPTGMARKMVRELPDGRTLPRHKAKRLGTIEDHLIGKTDRKEYGRLRDRLARVARPHRRSRRGQARPNR